MCWKCDHPDSTVDEWLDEIDRLKTQNGWAVQYVEDDRGHRPWCPAFADGQGTQPVLGVRATPS